MRRILRRMRGALGTAVLWGVSWFTTMFGALGLGAVAGWLTGPDPWTLAFLVSLNVGITGFLTGAVFSGYLGVAYRDRQLLDLSAFRVAMGGAAAAAAFSVAMAGLRTAVGVPFIFGDLISGVIWVGLLGSITAGASIRLAQGAAREITSGATGALSDEQEGVDALLAEAASNPSSSA